ncbi:hypothetical protein CLOP_g16754, partial [Closterium sp. NIES-67]
LCFLSSPSLPPSPWQFAAILRQSCGVPVNVGVQVNVGVLVNAVVFQSTWVFYSTLWCSSQRCGAPVNGVLLQSTLWRSRLSPGTDKILAGITFIY